MSVKGMPLFFGFSTLLWRIGFSKKAGEILWCFGLGSVVIGKNTFLLFLWCSRKNSYKLDWCYEQDENIDQIFTAEVKPLIEGLFRGHNGCVIAYGAPGSGKSQLIQVTFWEEL